MASLVKRFLQRWGVSGVAAQRRRPRRPARRPTVERLEDRAVPSAAHEVWMLDQSNTRDESVPADGTLDSGGTLYIYQGDDLAGANAAAARPEVIDLGGEARDRSVQLTGTAPVRPHFITFNPTHTHAIISFVATGHVLFMDAATRSIVDIIDVGAQAHAAVTSPDGSYVLVANQNGKLLQRIDTDVDNDGHSYENAADIALDPSATLDLAPLQVPGVRPDNAPIYTVFDPSGRLAFVTLRGGGLFVVGPTTSPISIVASYSRALIDPSGLLGLTAKGKVYLNSGVGAFLVGSTPVRDPQSGVDLYSLPLSAFTPGSVNPPNTPTPTTIIDLDGVGDAHGMVLTRHDRYLWMVDRQRNLMFVIDTTTDQVVNQFDLTGPASADPAPDILGISPSGNRIYASLRGPNPLTGNIPSENNAAGSTPGVGIFRVEMDGKHGVLQAVAPISHVVGGVERADPHGLAVRVLPRAAGRGGLVSPAATAPVGGARQATASVPPSTRPAQAFPARNEWLAQLVAELAALEGKRRR